MPRRSVRDTTEPKREAAVIEAVRLELGNGTAVEVPAFTAEDRDPMSGHRQVVLPDLRKMAHCERCNGYCSDKGDVRGGFIQAWFLRLGRWYAFAHACPDCVYGAYRHLCLKEQAPFYTQLPEAGARDVALLLGAFGPKEPGGAVPGTLREAILRVQANAPRQRLLEALAALEASERHAFGQMADPAGVGF